jgi:hypothetical protein
MKTFNNNKCFNNKKGFRLTQRESQRACAELGARESQRKYFQSKRFIIMMNRWFILTQTIYTDFVFINKHVEDDLIEKIRPGKSQGKLTIQINAKQFKNVN